MPLSSNHFLPPCNPVWVTFLELDYIDCPGKQVIKQMLVVVFSRHLTHCIGCSTSVSYVWTLRHYINIVHALLGCVVVLYRAKVTYSY